MGLFLILTLALVFLLILWYGVSHFKSKHHFESKGIPYQGNGTIRLIINSMKGIGLLEGITMGYEKMKKKGHTIAGANDFGKTTLIVQDVELLKCILVKVQLITLHNYLKNKILNVIFSYF